uniref:Cytochrome c6 n=1 Tax=Gastroclonium compressum TaxID=1852973 RepID=A0A173FZT7_GASCM|nr:cytochrome c553 [Coeloseira compressa]ANH09540.1 cytochrome c553 [Coeloseira compressa]
MRSILIFCSLLVTLLFTNPTENTFAGDLTAGEQIFNANCSACHAGGNNAIMPEKTLKKDILSDNNMNNITAITNQVKNGKNAMPAFGGRLADEDIENVATYVLDQSEKGWE